MTPSDPAVVPPPPPKYIAVQLDGKIVGYLPSILAKPVLARLNAMKAAALSKSEGLREGSQLPELSVRGHSCNRQHILQSILSFNRQHYNVVVVLCILDTWFVYFSGLLSFSTLHSLKRSES